MTRWASASAVPASPHALASPPPPSDATHPPPSGLEPSYRHPNNGISMEHAAPMKPHTHHQHPDHHPMPAPTPPATTALNGDPSATQRRHASQLAAPEQQKPTTASLSSKIYHLQLLPNSPQHPAEHSRPSWERSQMQFPPPQPTAADTNPSSPPSAGTPPTPSTDNPTPSNITPGARKWCKRCHKLFASGNQLHQHLSTCRTRHPAPPANPPTLPTRKRKQPAELTTEPTEPSTYSDFASAPPRKIRRFTHHSPAVGDVDAVESNGTTFYNTTPPNHDPALEYAAALRAGM